MAAFPTPAFDRYRVELRLAQPVALPFEHGGVLRGLVSRALGRHRLPPGLIPFACESGQVRFAAGDGYALGLTLAGAARALADDLLAGLERLGTAHPEPPAPILGGNFALERVERLPAPDLAADAAALGERVELQLRAPLRLERPAALKRPGAGHLDRDCFPADFFLDRLLRRLFFLAEGRYPDAAEVAALSPPADQCSALADDLWWSDLPVRGTRQKGRPYTLGGARGVVALEGLADGWREILAAGSYLHAGSSTAYGFGRYAIAGTSSVADPLLDRARPLAARLAEPALPAPSDEEAERAAAELLAPAIDGWLEESSSAYRHGFSRQGAARAVERHHADGYRYVLDADLSAFYDRVDGRILFSKLEALYPGEPVLDRIRAWVTAPAVVGGRRLERDRGLPAGSPLSPLLAKLYLDVFDRALRERGLRLARLGDDFVVLAKDPEEARQAKAEALAGELEGDSGGESWLAALPMERIETLRGVQRPHGRTSFERVPLSHAEALDQGRWPLYVTSPETRVHLRRGAVVVGLDGGEERELPISALSHAVFVGRVRATLPVLRGLARDGVPSYFCRASGELEAVFGPVAADWPLWLEQARRAGDERWRVAFAAAVVAARLRNLAAIAVRFGWGGDVKAGASEAAAQLRGLAREAANKETVEEIRGLEGRGAALAWGALARSLPAEWGFAGRERRPPPDPVNAMLSFGYTLLYNHAATALMECGLDPRIGLFHRPRGTHAALASDLMEELRHLVESLVWTLIRRRQLTVADFGPSPDGRYPALLVPAARKVFVHAFERRLVTEFTPEGEEAAVSYRAFLWRQARQIRDLVRGARPLYSPLVLRA